MVRRVGLAMTVAVVLLAAGCGDERDVKSPAESDAWRTSTDPVVTSGLAWAADSTVHLSDGTTIDTGGPVSAFAVAGDGVFFLAVQSEEQEGSADFPVQELQFGAPGKSPTGTGLMLSGDLLAASPDGRYLAGIDTTSGEKDDFGTPQATTLVFDLQTGEQIVDSTLGMGDPAEDDFADGYSESELQIWGMTNERLHVSALEDVVFDLATGEGEEGERPLPGDEHISPDGKWRIDFPEEGPVRIVGTDGQEVVMSVEGPRWNLYWWADDRTAVGTHITGPNTGNRTKPGDSVALMTCQVPSGECEVFEETAGQTVIYAYGSTYTGVILPDGDES